MRAHSRGAALIDVVFTCGLVAVIAAIAIPTLHATRDRDAARMAARYLANRLHVVRTEAIRRNTQVALRVDADDRDFIGMYADGDGDGVLQRDIDRGIDRAIAPDVHLADLFAAVALNIAADVPDPDGNGTLLAGSDPVRIGSSTLWSFSPIGSATSGTVYLAARTGPQVALRVLGATGRTRVLWFDAASSTWREE
ncbi:MAG TPA: GspH/FimT family pseudopilin [Vicinamibacterales bacterium]|nr:GspH/FimT family pseudopilin [Vicinamibacterales bacterium]